jgi:hypothetical protein
MTQFANVTGLTGSTNPRRYLWTDAFAVCNFLGLYRRTGNNDFLALARSLVDQVHHILGRHRDDDTRRGWISGLSEDEGERHPTRSGLRIGKTRNERGPDEPMNSRLEWDRDGQYFHYLTKWMHALFRMGRETGEDRYQRWAVELATAAVNAFTFETSAGGPKRMVWKMSIDLSRPLVSSMGHHDPIDGLITCLELQTHNESASGAAGALGLAIADLSTMCEHAKWVTDDPLGIGGLLDDAARLAQLVFDHGLEQRHLLLRLLVDAELSLRIFTESSSLGDSPNRRLAFRELGLAIGIHGLEFVKDHVQQDRDLAAIVERGLRHRTLAEQIEIFWSDSRNRLSTSWNDHRDINTVMLATSLAPEGYLQI